MSLESRLKKLEAAQPEAQPTRSLMDLTPWVLDAPADDYIHGAWARFLLIQPWAAAAGAQCCVSDSMAVSMALKRVPVDVWPDYESLYQAAELHRQQHHAVETLPERMIENA